MLNKKICYRCVRERYVDEMFNDGGEFTTLAGKSMWLQTHFQCGTVHGVLHWEMNYVKGWPPVWCPYALEHLVSMKC